MIAIDPKNDHQKAQPVGWTSAQASALNTVISGLNEARLEWMVLRNYEGLPEQNRSKDVDIMVKKTDFARTEHILFTAMAVNGFSVYSRSRFQYVWSYIFFNIKKSSPVSIKIDLFDGHVWRGAHVVKFADLYAHKVPYAGFYVPNAVYDGFMLWLKTLMFGGFIKHKYRDDISRTLKHYPDEFHKLLVKTTGRKYEKVIWRLLENGSLDETVPYQRKLRYAAWLVAFRNDPVQTILEAFEHYYRELIRRTRRPKPSMIAVVGPDGTGKSTFIDLLQKEICRCLVKDADDVPVLHFRPNIFPNIKKLVSGKGYDETTEEFTAPHRAKPSGSLLSLVRISYYWLDYVLGYWLRVRGRCIAGQVYLYDRYFYDIIVDPFRSRIKLPEWIRLLFLRMTPAPDVVFFLDGDAAEIYARKQELTRSEIELQLQRYRILADRFKHFVTLDARKRPEELCNDALRHLVERSFSRL